jgi:Skp family chaperone for outer membrane proteins
MRPPVVVLLVVVAILIGFGIGYFWHAQQISKVQAELSDVKSRMGIEIQNLKNEAERLKSQLAEAEGRLKEEQAARKVLEESLKKARLMK